MKAGIPSCIAKGKLDHEIKNKKIETHIGLKIRSKCTSKSPKGIVQKDTLKIPAFSPAICARVSPNQSIQQREWMNLANENMVEHFQDLKHHMFPFVQAIADASMRSGLKKFSCYADMDYNAIVKNLATGYVLYGNCSPTVSNVSLIT